MVLAAFLLEVLGKNLLCLSQLQEVFGFKPHVTLTSASVITFSLTLTHPLQTHHFLLQGPL